MSKYDVNFKRLALLMLPTFWRRPLLATFAYAMVTPLNYLHTRFVLLQRSTDYRLTHNGQVCYLRAVLNDQFDPIERRITITEEAGGTGPLMLWHRSEDRAQLLPIRESDTAFIVNRRGFDGVNSFDFWVNIPVALLELVDTTRLKAIVNTYKLASKRFSINYIQ
ncbi:MAG: hypothetical protein LBU97_02125 [Alistipes sp.]|jgi:hypothetical protein|nr:hypothetical protein [Alistipes sp.]